MTTRGRYIAYSGFSENVVGSAKKEGRASAAAPTYFAPERLQWDLNDPDKQFYFEDGGVTPYNNPSFLLFKMAVSCFRASGGRFAASSS